ncbi:hypothetical protein MNBD_GAMMA11-1852 [hydrothermal vent metagenome]|uniref:Uncharacterized protein n=1 Tax=hydrothermal vent metagenome TaxID=652676 RepID=A0A3B0X8K2_9ZZZZ
MLDLTRKDTFAKYSAITTSLQHHGDRYTFSPASAQLLANLLASNWAEPRTHHNAAHT